MLDSCTYSRVEVGVPAAASPCQYERPHEGTDERVSRCSPFSRTTPRGREGIEGGGRYAAAGEPDRDLCVAVEPTLVVALDATRAPVDNYLNGTQTWLTDDGPGGTTIEWRLHPVAAYRPPEELSHYDLWDLVVDQLRAGVDPGALTLGDQRRALVSLWDGLEVFPAYGDEIEPAVLAGIGTEVLGLPPDAAGLVDHARIGEAWEQRRRGVSIVSLLLEELRAEA